MGDMLFVAELGWRRWNGGGGCLPGHKLNINDDITYGFHQRVNFVCYSICIKDMSLYILALF